MRTFSVGFLRPDPAWNFCKPLKLIFTTLVLPVASAFYSMCYLFSNQYRRRRIIYTTKFVRYFFFIHYILIHFLSH